MLHVAYSSSPIRCLMTRTSHPSVSLWLIISNVLLVCCSCGKRKSVSNHPMYRLGTYRSTIFQCRFASVTCAYQEETTKSKINGAVAVKWIIFVYNAVIGSSSADSGNNNWTPGSWSDGYGGCFQFRDLCSHHHVPGRHWHCVTGKIRVVVCLFLDEQR